MTDQSPFADFTSLHTPPPGYEEPDYCTSNDHTDYLLDIDAGSIALTCITCGRPVVSDHMELISTGCEIPVTAAWHYDPGDGYVTEPDFHGTITPRDGAEQLRSERDQFAAAIDRTTTQMHGYYDAGLSNVNTRQVINLLSPTWPDGNYESPSPNAPQPPQDDPSAPSATNEPDEHPFEPQQPAADPDEAAEEALDEARELARALYAAATDLADNLGDLSRIDPRLDIDERLPHWLTNLAGAPETWDRTEDPYEGLTLADVDPGAIADSDEYDRIAEFEHDARHDAEDDDDRGPYGPGPDDEEYDDQDDEDDEGPF